MHSDWREKIVDEALTWRGTPFHHKGRIKQIGVDCGGLIYQVYKTVLGIPGESFPTNYPEDWALHKDDNEIYLNFLKPYIMPTKNLLPADIVVFKMGRSFGHGVIYIGQNQFIHAYGKTGTGSVTVNHMRTFNSGMGGKQRPNKKFTLDTSKCF
jgi:cell wall-associated NlpC family hydrolase